MTWSYTGSIEKISWGYNEAIRIDKLPELDKDEIYISHVGDGEYSFNVFGSAHRDMKKYLKILRDRYKLHNNIGTINNEVYIYKYETGYLICTFYEYNNKIRVWEIARLTIEEIDPEKFPIGE
jgi:hypothetical protein